MSASSRPIEFRSTRLGATVAVLQLTEPPLLADALHKMLGGMPDFFNGEALVFDFSALPAEVATIDWAGLNSLMRRFQLQPIGAIGLAAHHVEGARRAGLAQLDGALDTTQLPVAPPPPPPPAPAPRELAPPQTVAAIAAPTMFVDRMLRSGQQIYARDADLVIIGGVSPGAEIIADGSIHCYGPLRGRAIAGAQGAQDARIITSNFGPELVSIAGVFRTFEGGIPAAVAGHAAQVRLVGSEQSLRLEALQLD